jgi:hypothetical protein
MTTNIMYLGCDVKCEIDANGNKWWHLNGEFHRTDGPAIEYIDGYKYWYINGKEYLEEDFNMVKEVLWAI